MKRLLKRSLILLLPFLILVGYFIVFDPMRVIYSAKSPLEKGVLVNDRLFQYRWLSEKHYDYNSFIFGSSRSKAFHTDTWSEYCRPGIPFHMGVNDETLFGINKKMHMLQDLGYKIKNALIVLDYRILSLPRDHKSHIFMEYYKVSGLTKVEYYKTFFIAFLQPDFLKAYFSWIFGSGNQINVKNYLWTEDFSYNEITGDHYYSEFENELKKDSVGYYSSRNNVFYNRDTSNQVESSPVIGNEQKSLLLDIRQILREEKTDFRIVISPNYDLKKINAKDLLWIKNTFGEMNVFDFSGINRFTKNKGNFYEEKHFKPYVANELLKTIYAR